MEPTDATALSSCPTTISGGTQQLGGGLLSPMALSPGDTRTGSMVTSKEEEEDSSNAASSDCKSPGQRYVVIIRKKNIFFLPILFSFKFPNKLKIKFSYSVFQLNIFILHLNFVVVSPFSFFCSSCFISISIMFRFISILLKWHTSDQEIFSC